jgi:hypothetical protein
MKTAVYLLLALGAVNGLAQAPKPAGGTSASIQHDLDANPNLQRLGLSIRVVSFKDGYVTLSVRGLNNEATEHLKRTGDLGDTAMCCAFDKAAAIARATQYITDQKLAKDIVWTAESANDTPAANASAVSSKFELAGGWTATSANPNPRGGSGDEAHLSFAPDASGKLGGTYAFTRTKCAGTITLVSSSATQYEFREAPKKAKGLLDGLLCAGTHNVLVERSPDGSVWVHELNPVTGNVSWAGKAVANTE